MLKYEYKEPDQAHQEIKTTLKNGLHRELSDDENRFIKWLSTSNYETHGVLLNIFQELIDKNNNKE